MVPRGKCRLGREEGRSFPRERAGRASRRHWLPEQRGLEVRSGSGRDRS